MLTTTINAVMALFLSGALYLVQVQNDQNEHSMWKTIETKPFVCASYETTSLNLHWQMSNQYDYRWLWCVCVWVLFVFLHLISVTLVLRLILWWFCDRIYKCGGFFLSLLERVSHAKRAVEAVRWSCKRLLRWWWSKICVCIFIVCHGERSDATTMPTKAVVDGCEKC